MFQRLSFYLKYYEKQLIVDLKNKINSRLRAVWIDQLVQLEFLKEIRLYLIRLNNDQWAMQDIKEKNAINKVKIIKWVIFVEKISKFTFYKKIKATKFMNLSNSHDAILTNVKDTDLQAENCFLCYKSDHISRECLNQSSRVNALNKDEFNHSVSESDSDSKTSHLFKSHWKDKDHIFVQSSWSSIERKLPWKVVSDQCLSHLSASIFQSLIFDRQWFHHLHADTC
jgi:hypothetical protein